MTALNSRRAIGLALILSMFTIVILGAKKPTVKPLPPCCSSEACRTQHHNCLEAK